MFGTVQKISGIASDGLALIRTAYDQYEQKAAGSSTQKIVDAGNVLEGNLSQALTDLQIQNLGL